MLSLLEVAEYINAGKRKYGKSLIYHMEKYYADNHSHEYVLKKLKNEHGIDISLSLLQKLKLRYYNTNPTKFKSRDSNSPEPKNKIALNQEMVNTSRQDASISNSEYQKLRDSIDFENLSQAEIIIKQEKEHNEKLRNLLKRKKTTLDE